MGHRDLLVTHNLSDGKCHTAGLTHAAASAARAASVSRATRTQPLLWNSLRVSHGTCNFRWGLVLKQGPMRGVSVWAYRERPSGHLFPGVGDGIHEVAPLATEGKVMRPPFVVSLLAVALLAVAFAALPSSEAPTGFDNQSNGMVDDATHQADQVKFDEVENVSDGLGPLYNAQSCRECHQSPVSGGGSQVAELRVGHEGAHHRFETAEIPIARGTEIITGRTLVNERAICPNGAFPNTEIQERLPDSGNVRTTRLSLSLLGDGFVEAVADQTFIELARKQCKETHHKICGQAIFVPILEAHGHTGVGRFGWKDQHASLLSFSGDAYLNEMGITTRLFPDEVTKLCNTASEPNDVPDPDGLDDLDHFARFIRATKAPARDGQLPTWRNFSGEDFHNARFKVRTAPLWSVRLRSRLMHDGASVTLRDAVTRHGGEASEVMHHFEKLSHADQEAILEFLRSL